MSTFWNMVWVSDVIFNVSNGMKVTCNRIRISHSWSNQTKTAGCVSSSWFNVAENIWICVYVLGVCVQIKHIYPTYPILCMTNFTKCVSLVLTWCVHTVPCISQGVLWLSPACIFFIGSLLYLSNFCYWLCMHLRSISRFISSFWKN